MLGPLRTWSIPMCLLVTLLWAPTPYPAEPEKTVTLDVLLKTDDLGLIGVSAFTSEATTPAAAWARFAPEVQATLRKWWADPNDEAVTKEEERLATAAVRTAVREHNAPRLTARIAEFESQLKLVAPGAELATDYLSGPYYLHLVSAKGVPESAAARVSALSVVESAAPARIFAQS